MFRRSTTVQSAVALSLMTFALAAHAGLASLTKGTAEVHAAAKGLGGFDGKLGEISATEKDGRLVFSANLTQGLDMGIRNRDAFKRFKIVTKEEVGEGKRPTFAKLTVDRDKLKFPEDKKELKGRAPATLTLAGKSVPVTVEYKVSRTGSDYHLKEASFTFNYKAIIPEICLPGGVVCVKDAVTIQLKQLKLRDKS